MTTIAITSGTHSGVGPELAIKALGQLSLPTSVEFVWCAGPKFLKDLSSQYQVHCVGTDQDDEADSLMIAINLAKSKKIDAMVTMPIKKAALSKLEGGPFLGQTELLEYDLKKSDAPSAQMCFVGGPFALGLATTHVPVLQAAELITQDTVFKKGLQLADFCQQLYSLKRTEVRLDILGLNPHAGENGLIGEEDVEQILPAVNKLKELGIQARGPVSADGFFGQLYARDPQTLPHGVLAMMHDQGLAPYKLLCQGKIVNVTLGLTIPRTSPGHGTAEDIAGKNLASADATIKAFEVAFALQSNTNRS